ncbi:hypothetical protein [Photobacterium swingsii]|uniref:hypothetical protein n=1 Tax=Photobacterium swingsii TaxID=680026 RepID=UPI0040693136
MVRISLLLIMALSFSVNSASLTSAYNDYLKGLTFQNIENNYSQYFSDILVGDIDISDDYLKKQLMFKESMKSIDELNETLYSNYGCLTVNGFDFDNQPMSFNIEYTKESPRALIKAVDILLLESKLEFSNKAVCPKEYIVE